MEAATQKTAPAATEPTAADRELAVKLGSVMLHILGSQGGEEVIRALDESGLNFVQMKMLVNLAGDDARGEPSSVKSLGERLSISVPSASRAVDELVKDGIATRAEDAEDRRIRRVALTPKGQRIADTIMAARLRGLEAFISGLTDDERTALEPALEVLLEREEIAETYSTNLKRSRTR